MSSSGYPGSDVTPAESESERARKGQADTSKPQAAIATLAAKSKSDGEDKLKDEVRKWKEQVKKLQAQLEKKGEEDDDGEADSEEINEEITQLRKPIAALEDMAKTDQDAALLLDKKRVRLEELLGVKRSAKPVDGQIKDVEAALERRAKGLKRQQELEKEYREKAEESLAGAEKAAAEQVRIKLLIEGLEAQRNALHRRTVPGSTVKPKREAVELA